MKTFSRPFLTALAAASMSLIAIAQSPEGGTSASGSGAGGSRSRSTTSGTPNTDTKGQPLAETAPAARKPITAYTETDLLQLFRLLDTDKDNSLSLLEFSRMPGVVEKESEKPR